MGRLPRVPRSVPQDAYSGGIRRPFPTGLRWFFKNLFGNYAAMRSQVDQHTVDVHRYSNTAPVGSTAVQTCPVASIHAPWDPSRRPLTLDRHSMDVQLMSMKSIGGPGYCNCYILLYAIYSWTGRACPSVWRGLGVDRGWAMGSRLGLGLGWGVEDSLDYPCFARIIGD